MSVAVRVLIGFADAFAAVESAWSLADAGFEVFAFARAGTRPPLLSSRVVRTVFVTAPEVDAHACARDVAALAVRVGAQVLLPLDDLAVWVCDAMRCALPPAVRVAGPTGDAGRFALDKREQLAQARAAGFAVPARGEQGPWMVKCGLAVVERDGRLVRPAGRLARTAEQVGAVAERIGGPVVVQRALTGVGEGVFGFAHGGGITGWSAHRRIRMANPRGSGSSACRSIDVAEPVRAHAEKLMAGVGWRGMFMVELLRDADGVPWFMEVNGRAWGSMALALRRGYDYPLWAVRQALDPDFRPASGPAEAPHVVCRHLGRELIHLAAVLRGPTGADVGRWPKRGRTLREMRFSRADRWYNARRGEARVFVRDTWSALVGEMAGRLRRGRS